MSMELSKEEQMAKLQVEIAIESLIALTAAKIALFSEFRMRQRISMAMWAHASASASAW